MPKLASAKRRSRLRRAETRELKRIPLWDSFTAKNEFVIVVILCIVAAVRIFIFSAAFPFFNNVDEQAHYDLVYKYSKGQIPNALEKFSAGASELIVLFSSPEYLCDPLSFPNAQFPKPMWNLPPSELAPALKPATTKLMNKTNYESTQPPVFYIIAGLWHRLGELLNLHDGMLLYWIRFLNAVLFIPLVLLSHRFIRILYPDRLFMRIGAPAMIAFFPQDVFFSINNDVVSPLFFTATLLCLLEIYLSRSKSYAFYVFTGLLVAVTFMVKFTNAAILVALIAVAALRIIELSADARIGRELPKIVLMIFSAITPTALFLTRNLLVLGDITGMSGKINILGWTAKPFAQIWHHPIFTPEGLITFWSDLMKTFWRGELVWHKSTVAVPWVDSFYWISTTIFLLAAAVNLILYKRQNRDTGWIADIFAFGVIGLSVLGLAVISLAYDFGRCWYPSSQHPYLTSGRLIIGIMVPFIALYLRAIEFILWKTGLRSSRWLALCIILGLMLGSEIAISIPVFGSLYNWFHMI